MKDLFKIAAIASLTLAFTGCADPNSDPIYETLEPSEVVVADDQDQLPELTGDTNKDYLDTADHYMRKIKNDGQKALADFNKETENFNGTKTEIQQMYLNYSRVIFHDLDEFLSRSEEIYTKDPGRDKAVKNEYEEQVTETYKEVIQELDSLSSDRMANAKAD